MLKKSASFVLASFRSSTGTRPPHHSPARTNLVLLIRRTVRPRGYASGFFSPAALLGGHFEHPSSLNSRKGSQILKYFSMLIYRSPVSQRMVTTFLPGPSSWATFCEANTLAPAEIPTKRPSFFESCLAV